MMAALILLQSHSKPAHQESRLYHSGSYGISGSGWKQSETSSVVMFPLVGVLHFWLGR